MFNIKWSSLAKKMNRTKPNKITEQTERLKSELFSPDFRQCPKSELFHNATTYYEKRQNQNVRISDTNCMLLVT